MELIAKAVLFLKKSLNFSVRPPPMSHEKRIMMSAALNVNLENGRDATSRKIPNKKECEKKFFPTGFCIDF